MYHQPQANRRCCLLFKRVTHFQRHTVTFRFLSAFIPCLAEHQLLTSDSLIQNFREIVINFQRITYS